MSSKDYKADTIRHMWSQLVGAQNVKELRFDENGWSDYRCRALMPREYWNSLSDKLRPYKTKQPSGKDVLYRPLSLKGIDDNNGWVRIFTRSDLPLRDGMYIFLVDGRQVPQWFDEDVSFSKLHTHWREMVEIPSPLY